ncbi:MAG: nuclear transport factor 2 family protein [Actinobacteria bacterium]|nr:nuclear transport factor 2 family protein [Actinomycetota bacterium]
MTNTTTTHAIDLSDQTAVVDTWLAAYTEPDAGRRAQLIAQTWSTDGYLADPPFDGTGHEALSGLADVVLTHYAGHTFRRTTAVDAHHEFARYGWELVGPDGTVSAAGTDFVTFAPDGKLARTVGFFGPLEA